MSIVSRGLEFWRDIRGLQPLSPHSEFEPILPDVDAEEESEIETVDDAPPKWHAEPISGRIVVISYCDSKDQLSERQISCLRLEQKAEHLYLLARCHSRQRLRNFRSDRIRAVIDSQSGEIFEPGEAFLALFDPDSQSAAQFRYGMSPQQFADFNAALNVLAFMARCDGEWHPLEAEALEDFATSYWLRAEISAALDLQEVARHAARLSPDPEIFWASLLRCTANRIISQIIRRHVAAVIDADGIHHPLEIYWGREVQSFLAN